MFWGAGTQDVMMMIACDVDIKRDYRTLNLIMTEAIRKEAGVSPESEEWRIIKDYLTGRQMDVDSIKGYLSDSAKQDRFYNISIQLVMASRDVLYAGNVYVESLSGENRGTDLFVHIANAYNFLRLIVIADPNRKEEVKNIENQCYADVRMGAAFGRLMYQKNASLAIAVYKKALERMPACAAQIAESLAHLAGSEKGREVASDGRTFAMLAEEVANGLGDPVAGEFERITSTATKDKIASSRQESLLNAGLTMTDGMPSVAAPQGAAIERQVMQALERQI